MANICLTHYTNGFFASVPKSPTQMGSLSVYNSVTNISRLGTFNNLILRCVYHLLFLFLTLINYYCVKVLEAIANRSPRSVYREDDILKAL
jgi:hypothetical protein